MLLRVTDIEKLHKCIHFLSKIIAVNQQKVFSVLHTRFSIGRTPPLLKDINEHRLQIVFF